MKPRFRIGNGYDIHPLVAGGVLTLGGITIPADRGYRTGTDHDVLLHSLIDALAGALCLGDVSDFLTDSSVIGASNADPFKALTKLIYDAGYVIANVDFNIIVGTIMIRPYVQDIRRKVAQRLNIDLEQVSIKGRSNDGFREEGEGLAISSLAAVCVQARRGGPRLLDGKRG